MTTASQTFKSLLPPKKVEAPFWLQEIFEDETEDRDFYITKGLGSGGTFGSAVWHFAMCLINKNSKHSWHVSPTYTESLIVALPEFEKVLTEFYGLTEGSHYRVIYGAPPKIVFSWGQVIRFMSAERWKKLVGANISHSTATEPGIFHAEAFNKISDRTRCPNAKRIQRLWEGTPEGVDNEYAKRADFRVGVEPKRNARRVIVTTYQNPHLKPGYVQSLERRYEHDPGKRASYIDGLFKPFTRGTAYPDFVESALVTDQISPQLLDIHLTFDWQASPIAWSAWQKQTHFVGQGLVKVDYLAMLAESSGHSRGLKDAVNEFVYAFPAAQYGRQTVFLWGGHDGYAANMFADQSAFSLVRQELQRAGFSNVSIKAPRAAPKVRERLEIVNSLFRARCVKLGDWCRNSIKGYSQAALKDGTWELIKKRGEDPTHFPDAGDYFLYHQARAMGVHGESNKRSAGVSR